MSQQELLARAIEVLDISGIPYMVTGSTASSYQGTPRASHDIDLVVSMETRHVGEFMQAFPAPDYYLSEAAVKTAIEHRQMFNLLDVNGGDKIDFWLLTDEEFDRSRFNRRVLVDTGRLKFYVSSPEDTILAKLRWAKLCGGSEKQMHDATEIFRRQSTKLDIAYIDRWVDRLSVQEFWSELLSNAGRDGNLA